MFSPLTNPSLTEENQAGLLFSPYEPNSQMQYFNNNMNMMEDQFTGLPSSPINMPNNNNTNDNMSMIRIDGAGSLSSMNMSNPDPLVTMDKSLLYSNYGYPDMASSLPNEFISRSPESSSSAESNLVSPPPRYFNYPDYTDFIWSEPIPMANMNMKDTTRPRRRSSSVPPRIQGLSQEHIYPSLPVTHTSAAPVSVPPKPLPIQIQRIHPLVPTNRPVNMELHRLQLDEKLEKVNFDDITVAELKEMLRERGLSATGRKAELLGRLKEEYDNLMRKGHRKGAMSPKKRHINRLYAPYNSYLSPATNNKYQLATSAPNDHTQSYLNEQYLLNNQVCPTIGKSVDDNQLDQQLSYPVMPSNHMQSKSMVWDDPSFQSFLTHM
ncbi:hypothetical protein BDB01DRAFT_802815 [Pilobolus umbonatus]|nr:hypothetical protein BDB01DRAFT_802815 [Pilobolus umbonatus]